MTTKTQDLVVDAKDLIARLQVHTVYPEGGNPHLMRRFEDVLLDLRRRIGRFLIRLAVEDSAPPTEDLKERLCTALQIRPSRWRTILESPVSADPRTVASIDSLADPTTGALRLFLEALHSFVSGQDSQDDDCEIPSHPSTGSWQHEARVIGGELIRLHNTAPTTSDRQNDPKRFMQYVDQLEEVGDRARRIEDLPHPNVRPFNFLVWHTTNLANDVARRSVEYSAADLGEFWEGMARGTRPSSKQTLVFEGIRVDETQQTLTRGAVVSVWGGSEGWRLLHLLIKSCPGVVTKEQIGSKNCSHSKGQVQAKLVQDGFKDLADRIESVRGVGYKVRPAPDMSEG